MDAIVGTNTILLVALHVINFKNNDRCTKNKINTAGSKIFHAYPTSSKMNKDVEMDWIAQYNGDSKRKVDASDVKEWKKSPL